MENKEKMIRITDNYSIPLSQWVDMITEMHRDLANGKKFVQNDETGGFDLI